MSHFQQDYERLVANLLASHPTDEAMSLAVGGGDFEHWGNIEYEILRHYGLHKAMSLVDVGCGSGRLTQALDRHGWFGQYTGLDVVPTLLDYARRWARPGWALKLVDGLTIDVREADMVCFFSVFTHLKPEETYVYLESAYKALKPGGRVVASFLDYRRNWDVFEAMCEHVRRRREQVHLNTFLHREHLTFFASKVGFRLVDLADRDDFGQSLIVLER